MALWLQNIYVMKSNLGVLVLECDNWIGQADKWLSELEHLSHIRTVSCIFVPARILSFSGVAEW